MMRDEPLIRASYSRARDRGGTDYASGGKQFPKGQAGSWGGAGALTCDPGSKGGDRWLSSSGSSALTPRGQSENRHNPMKTAPGAMDAPMRQASKQLSSSSKAGYSSSSLSNAPPSRQMRSKPAQQSMGPPSGEVVWDHQLPYEGGGGRGGAGGMRASTQWGGGGPSAYETDGRPGTRGGGTAYDLEGRPVTRGGTRPPSRMQLAKTRPSFDGMGSMTTSSGTALPPGGQLVPLSLGGTSSMLQGPGLSFRAGASGMMDRPGSRIAGEQSQRSQQWPPQPSYEASSSALGPEPKASRKSREQQQQQQQQARSGSKAAQQHGRSGQKGTLGRGFNASQIAAHDDPDIDAAIDDLSGDDNDHVPANDTLYDLTNFLNNADKEAASSLSHHIPSPKSPTAAEEPVASPKRTTMQKSLAELNPKVVKMAMKVLDKLISETVTECEINKAIQAAEAAKAKETEENADSLVNLDKNDWQLQARMLLGKGPDEFAGLNMKVTGGASMPPEPEPSWDVLPQDDFRHLSTGQNLRPGSTASPWLGQGSGIGGGLGMAPAPASSGMARYAQRRI